MSASTTSRRVRFLQSTLVAALTAAGVAACGPPMSLDSGPPVVDPERPAPGKVWSRDLGRALEFPPVAVDGAWLVAPTHGDLWKLRAEDGETLWKEGLPGTPTAAPLVFGTVVVVTTDVPKGEVIARDLASGDEVWKWGALLALPAGDGTHLVLAARGGRVLRVDPADGEELWEIELPGSGWRAPVLRARDDLVVVPVRPDSLVALDLGDGARRWAVSVGRWPEPAFGETGLAVTTADSTVTLVDPQSGEAGARLELGYLPAGPPVMRDGTCFVTLRNGAVLALDALTLETRWRRTVDPPVRSAPEPSGNRLLVAGAVGIVHVLDAATGNWIEDFAHPELLIAPPRAQGDLVAAGGDKGTFVVYRRGS